MKIPKEDGTPIKYNEGLINIIRGKAYTYPEEIRNEIHVLCRILDTMEARLDEYDLEDFFGTQGWRYIFADED